MIEDYSVLECCHKKSGKENEGRLGERAHFNLECFDKNNGDLSLFGLELCGPQVSF